MLYEVRKIWVFDKKEDGLCGNGIRGYLRKMAIVLKKCSFFIAKRKVANV